MATFSAARLSDKTLAKYKAIIDGGGELTPRQKSLLESRYRMVGWSKAVDEAYQQGLRGNALISMAIYESTAKVN